MRTTTALIGILCTTAAMANDWPQFNGPDRSGAINDVTIARNWPESGPRLLWQVSLGEGFGGVSVQGDEVYILDRTPDASHDIFRCFDLATGQERWSHAYPTQGRFQYPGSRSTPTVTDTHVYSVGSFGHVYCFDRQARKPVWNRQLSEWGGEPPNWGYSQSPLVVGDRVIVAPMGRSTGMVALNRHDGSEIWKTPAIGGDAYTSPTLATLSGVPQILMLAGQGLISVDPETGKTLWRYQGYRCRNAIPSPTVLEDGRIFLTGGYRAGSAMIRVSRAGDEWRVEELFHINDGSMLHNAIFHDGHLYANLNTNENLSGGRRRRPGGGQDNNQQAGPVGIACLDLNGNILWKTGADPNVDRGGLIIVDGVIVSLGGQDGVLRLIEATPAGYKPIASARVFPNPGQNLWAPLAVAHGKLLVRNQRELRCLDVATR